MDTAAKIGIEARKSTTRQYKKFAFYQNKGSK